MPKIFIETNFSFPKLVSRYKKLIENASKDLHKALARTSKKMLKQGAVVPSLTNKARSKAEFAKYGRKPLYKTKALYKSIKGDKEGLHLLEYGRMHNYGEGKNKEREFIKFDEETQNKITEEFINGIDKALKK
jgi:hypothetical protein